MFPSLGLSDQCRIDRPTHLMAFQRQHPLVERLMRLLFLADPKMHFTGLAGTLWQLLGVSRSSKNPNMCTLWGVGWEAGRLSEVTVLFADCRNYTTLTRELGVEKLAPVMGEFFRATSDIVITHDGIVDHFLGDAVMALFNVPVKHEDHVDRAVTAAAQVQMAVPRINARVGGGRILQVGIGISTGFALVGLLGSTHPSDYTAVGDVVNIASRLQGQAAPGEVLVTEEVYQVVRSAFPNAKRQQYELKGISEPVVGYVLT